MVKISVLYSNTHLLLVTCFAAVSPQWLAVGFPTRSINKREFLVSRKLVLLIFTICFLVLFNKVLLYQEELRIFFYSIFQKLYFFFAFHHWIGYLPGIDSSIIMFTLRGIEVLKPQRKALVYQGPSTWRVLNLNLCFARTENRPHFLLSSGSSLLLFSVWFLDILLCLAYERRSRIELWAFFPVVSLKF